MYEEVWWQTPELGGQNGQPLLKDTGHRATPAGMKEGDGPSGWIHHGNGDTIGPCHSEKKTLRIRDVAVSIGAKDQPAVRVGYLMSGSALRSNGSPTMKQDRLPMNLMRVNDGGEPETGTESEPGDTPAPRRWDGEESKIFGPLPRIGVATRRTLDQPGEPHLPIRVSPETGVTRSKDLPDTAEVNHGRCRAYHGNGLPDTYQMDPGDLSD